MLLTIKIELKIVICCFIQIPIYFSMLKKWAIDLDNKSMGMKRYQICVV